ncbi:hypothetical protein WISP_66410 [Willisornis vidua]|uniref:Uncharacterized protein n=1 Tax=Willisornis vidua TaxID=1566151 RepID=A0ABQ9DDE6_9PASS|nr:hypothetical protein WISP_66410 [Willisornis vidua]
MPSKESASAMSCPEPGQADVTGHLWSSQLLLDRDEYEVHKTVYWHLYRAGEEALQRFVVQHNLDFNSRFNGYLEDDKDHTLWESAVGCSPISIYGLVDI